jgi:hypothetical protein
MTNRDGENENGIMLAIYAVDLAGVPLFAKIS